MRDKPTVAYQGDISGFAKSAPEKGARYDARSAPAQAYAAQLIEKQERCSDRSVPRTARFTRYTHALNGFAASLTDPGRPMQEAPGRAGGLGKPAIQRRHEQFPGFPRPARQGRGGLRAKRGLRGEDIIIGVIDTGIVQEHPSLDDTGYGPPPGEMGWHLRSR